jgi:1-acyl-sn-glycerol-3-phosphate acyltransferase
LLRSLPPPTDPLVSGLMQRRPISARMFFLLPRLLRILMPAVTFRGLEHLPSQGPYIIAPNHQGYLDPFIVCGGLPFQIFRQVFFVGAAEYFETPFMRWLAQKANCVLVDPDANLIPAMKAGAFGLAHGRILMLFPEGERSIDGTVKRFKKGASILSRHLGVPIVPVAIQGSFELWPRNRPLNWRALVPWSGHRIRVTVGAPVRFKASLSDADAAAELRAIVERLWTSRVI